MHRTTSSRRLRPSSIALLAVAPLAASALAIVAVPSAPAHAADPVQMFERVSTYPVFQNVPEGVDPAEPTVAEISAVSADGNTMAYTDALGGRIGFLDITDAAAPAGLGSHDVAGAGTDSPTSVAIVGDHALVVVDESTYPGLEDTPWADDAPALGERGGRLDVVTLGGDHDEVASIDLQGQPDSIAISPDGKYAAVAIENQRNEAFTPDGGDTGDLPQDPAGFVQIIDLADPDPAAWTATRVDLTAADLAGMDTPEDAEPEYVDINDDNKLAVTLQENNGVVVIDLATAAIEHTWSAGNAQVSGIDTTKNGIFDPTGSIDLPREPDSIQWVGDSLVATANEGDWKGGTRGWTVFDATDGTVVWDAGNSFERIATRHGLHNNDRAAKKGAEPEGLAFDEIGGTPYAFVGSERSNFVAVYDMTDPTAPAFVQALPTTNGPEGLLPIPGRNLLAVSSETDDASVLVRSTVALYELGADRPAFPSIVSADVSADEDSAPIGWGALGALSPDLADPERVWTASDSAYKTGRIYSVDLSQAPAVIDSVIEVTDAEGAKPALDIEGLAARADGGFWLANEGATGPENSLIRVDDAGVIQESVSLPADVASKLGKWGLEGVAATGSGDDEIVYVALQRALTGETAPRIGRYLPATGEWTWFGYTLETTSIPGDWLGLSEITVVDHDTLAVIERDKQNGTTAAVKRVYTVDLPATTTEEVTPLTKTLAIDVLPELRSRGGWTQEKLEGFTITSGGEVVAVTDNDGLADATGETQLLRLGAADEHFDIASGPVEVQILNTNDFHGRLKLDDKYNGAAVLSGAVKQLRTENPNTEFVSAGDLIGASTFESNILDDKPSIDVLNEAGLVVSAVGNHELDKGYADLVDRVMAPYDATANPRGGAEWAYLAANIEEPAGRDDIAPSLVREIDGIKVGYVGAVTEDLPALVSPAGLEGVEVSDIVEAVNAEAAQLKADGVDLVISLVHEGAPVGDCADASFTDAGTTWGNITQNLSADVDAIISGHTHQVYNCSIEVPAWADRPVTSRPVVSAGEYAANLNQLVFTVDPATGEVQATTQEILPLKDATSGDPLYPVDPAVKQIVDDAYAGAEGPGAQVLGKLAAPLNRAKLGESRGGESTLGNLVAEVHRWAGESQIAFMNPGGLRGDQPAGDVTYKQAALMQPFANTLVNLDLTGAQIEKVLEEQWQRTPAGEVPSRPMLRLGVSKGFRYTYTEKEVTVGGSPAFEGDVTGMWLDGVAIDPAATYRVTANSFLASGGDNFRGFNAGTHRADTGKIDLNAMVDYLAEFGPVGSPLTPDYDQRAVEVSGLAASYQAGEQLTLDVASWSMSTAGDKVDTEIQVKLGDTVLGTAALDNTADPTPYDNTGTATIAVPIPAAAAAGPATVTLVGATTGTVVTVPVTLTAADPTDPTDPTGPTGPTGPSGPSAACSAATADAVQATTVAQQATSKLKKAKKKLKKAKKAKRPAKRPAKVAQAKKKVKKAKKKAKRATVAATNAQAVAGQTC